MTIAGTGLPMDQAASACARVEDSACARVEELARAAKRAGHPGRIGPLRADIYLGLLDGRWQHLTREIIADLLTSVISNTDPDAHPQHDAATTPVPDGPLPPEGQTPPSDACAASRPGEPVAHHIAANGAGGGTKGVSRGSLDADPVDRLCA